MGNAVSVRRRMVWLVYIFIFGLLSPLMVWMGTSVLQLEYVIPFLFVGVVGSIFAYKNMQGQQYIILSIIDLSVILYFLFLVISMLCTPVSTMDILNQTMYLGDFLLYIFFRGVFSRQGIWLFIAIIILTVFLQILFSFYFQVGNFYSVLQFRGGFFNSAFLGEYLVIGIIALVACLYCNSGIKKKTIKYKVLVCVFVLGVLLLIYVLYKIMSRASWLSLSVSIIFLFWAKVKERLGYFVKYWLLSLLVLLFVGGFFYVTYSLKPNSVCGRFLIWEITLRMFLERPFLGYGFGGFRQNYMFFQKEYFDVFNDSYFSSLASDNAFVFNEFLKILVEQGILGFLVVIFLLYSIFCCHYNEKYVREVRVLQAMLLAITVFGCFSYPSEVMSFHIIVLILIAYLSNISEKKCLFSFRCWTRVNLVLFSLLWFCISIFSCKVCCFVQAGWKFHSIVLSFSRQKDDFIKLDKLYPELYGTIEYLTFYGKQLNQVGMYEQAISVFTQLGKCYPSSFQQIELGKAFNAESNEVEAENVWQNAAKMVPILIEPHYLLAKLYSRQGKYHEACLHGRIVLEQKLKVYTPEIFYMRKEIKEALPKWIRYSQINNR